MINSNTSRYMVFISALVALVYNKNKDQRAKLMAKCAELLSSDQLSPAVVHLTSLAAMSDESILKMKTVV